MNALSRELRWAAIALVQLPIVCSLTVVGRLLVPYAWFRDLFRIPNEAVLVPFWVGLGLTIPVSVAVMTVLTLDLVRSLRGRRVWVTAIEHVLAAMFGALCFYQWEAWTSGRSFDFSAGVLGLSYLVGNVVLAAIYWPRLVFRSLRAANPVPPR